MRNLLVMILILTLPCAGHVAAFDASVSIRDHVARNTSTITDAFTVSNEAYPNGSPASVTVNASLYDGSGRARQASVRNVSVNKYTYADTSNITIASNTTKVCVDVVAHNRTDRSPDNNEACKVFVKEPVSNTTEDDNTTVQNGSNQSMNDTRTNNTSNASTENKPHQEPAQEGNDAGGSTACDLISKTPHTINRGETVEFTVNAEQRPVRYWVEDGQGRVVKPSLETTNEGEKQYTPDEEEWVMIRAQSEACDPESVSVGVVEELTESYIAIDEVTAERPTIEVTFTHHHKSQRAVTVSTQDTELADVTLPSGTTTFSGVFPAAALESGVSSLTVDAGEEADTYRYRLKEEALKDRYPNLIESVYHRKEYFGPTTLYVSLREPVTGELVVYQDSGVERTDINGSNVQATVLPTTPEETIGVTVENRLAETVDETVHHLDLERRDDHENDAGSENASRASAVVDERSSLSPNQSAGQTSNTSVVASENASITAFRDTSRTTNTPLISAVGLLATLGYSVYWMRERT